MFLTRKINLFATIIFLALLTLNCSSITGSSDDGDNNTSTKFNSKAAPGDSAKSFLEGDQYSSLQIEIDYMPNHAPTQDGLDSLKKFLEERLNKQTISFRKPDQISSGGQNSYTDEDIRSIEENNRDFFTEAGSNTLQAYFLMVDGEYEQQNVLGIAYWNTSVAFFGAKMEEISGQPPTAPSEEKIEGTVFRHEFGHNMGLVGNGTPTQSDHKTSGSAHCTNGGCLMEPAVRTTDFFSNFTGNIPPLKEFCVEDLQANGGK